MVHAVTALRTLCGVAALLGVFAMHGLAAHGTAHQGHASELMGMVSAEHDDAAMTMDHGSKDSQVASTSGDRTPDPALFGLASLCLAVLLIGIALAVVLGRGLAVERSRGLTSRAGGRPTRARRDRDPPCLFALSIQRR